MAEPVKPAARRMALCSVMFAAACGQAMATAGLQDPTRPSNSWGAGSAAPAVSSGPVLQSVLIASGRRVAVISGQTVQVGDKVGDARIVAINESEVVLREGGKLQTMKVFPGIEKRPTHGGNPAGTGSRR